MPSTPQQESLLAFLAFLVLSAQLDSTSAQSRTSTAAPPATATSCTSFYSHSARQGAVLTSRLKIPMSKYFRRADDDASSGFQPGYRLELEFNRAIRVVNIRQIRARDMDRHRKFMIDTVPKDQELRIPISTVLWTPWSQNPSINRIILNDRVVCGQPLNQTEANQTILVQAAAVPDRLKDSPEAFEDDESDF